MEVYPCKNGFVLRTIVLAVILQLGCGEEWWEPLVEERVRLNVCPDRRDELCKGHVDEGKMCRCDGDCAAYGDCCADIAPAQQAGSSHWRCLSHLGREFYARSGCPEYYAEDDISRSCTGSAHQMRHIQQVPVFSEATRVMYANVFCAACNSDLSSLRPWTAGFYCSRHSGTEEEVDELLKQHKFQYSVGSRNFIYNPRDGGQRVFCQIRLENFEEVTFFQDLYGVRECRLYFSACPHGADAEDVRKCGMYTAMVYSPRKLANYRNVHCAKCRNVTVEGLECGARRVGHRSDVADVFHRVSQLTTTFRDVEKCHTLSGIYDPYFGECFEEVEAPRQRQSSPACSLTLTSSPLLVFLARAVFFAVLGR